MFKRDREQKRFLENYKKEILQEGKKLLIKILMKAKKLENQVFQFNYERPSNPFVVSNFTKEPLGDITIFPLEY